MNRKETITTTFVSDLKMTPEVQRALKPVTPGSVARKYKALRERKEKERKAREKARKNS